MTGHRGQRGRLGAWSALVAALAFVVIALPANGNAGAAPIQAEDCGGPVGDYPPEGVEVEVEGTVEITGGDFTPGGSGSISFRVEPRIEGDYCGTVFSTPIPLPPQPADEDGNLAWSGLAVPADFELDTEHHVELYQDQSGVTVLSEPFQVDDAGNVVPSDPGDGDGGPGDGGPGDGGPGSGGPGSGGPGSGGPGSDGPGSGGPGSGGPGSGGPGSGGPGNGVTPSAAVDSGASEAGSGSSGSGGPLAFTGLDSLASLVRVGAIALALGVATLYWYRRRLAGV